MIRTRASLSTVVLAAALAVGGVSDLRSSATAMACCARTRGQCAGVRSADDCCTRMTHAAPAVAAVLMPAPPSTPPPAVIVSTLSMLTRPGDVCVPRLDFKRPHDPPHLHAFALLI